ncbi:MAG: DUF92 domain-containing protein [Candidatus Micrarchaeota archaeon]
MDWMIEYAIPLFIVVIGLESKSLNMIGAISALLMSYVILLTQNIYWFLVLLSLLIIGVAVTNYGWKYKEKHKLMQKVRGAKNVMCNAGMGMIMAVLGGPAAPFGFVGAIATAAADTTSSELGVLSKSVPRMITNFRKSTPGVNGAISFFGTAAGMVSAAVVGCVSLLIIPDLKIISIAVIAGTIGNLADSYIGAVFENRRYWGNSTTNLIATSVGAIAGLAMYALLGF